MRADSPLTNNQIDEFIAGHRLPAQFRSTIEKYYLPLVDWIVRQRLHGTLMLVGISGAQGTGKSTLADFLKLALAHGAAWRVAIVALDDFYLTLDDRRQLAADVHPLLRTRGVPGTHDLQLLTDCLAQLHKLHNGEALALPRFDKARDDRAQPDDRTMVHGKLDVILFEGWCVGCPPQTETELGESINSLEREQDADGTWRRFVNRQLAGPYARLFAQLDRLIFLRAPDFAAIYRWRRDQERQLAERHGQNGPAVMDDAALTLFMQHYERLTRTCLEFLPARADAVLELDAAHCGLRLQYRLPIDGA